MANVTVRNTVTGRTGKIPERLYNSSAFNKDDVWVLYDGALEPDCGCNGLNVPKDEEPEEEVLFDISTYDKEEVG